MGPHPVNPHLTYLLLNLATLSFPLIRSFEPRVHYVGWWRALAVGLLFNGLYFLPTDIWFTARGIWAFSDTYTLGPRIAGLPIEEWLFFLAVPFACVFIYACVKTLLKVPGGYGWWLFGWVLAMGLMLTAVLNLNRAYTFVKLGSAGVFLALYLSLTPRADLGNFFVAFFLTEIPFLLVNGTLTYLPVVTYNDAENLGIRMSDLTGIAFFNIPVEDNFYSLMMLTLTIFFMNLVPGPHRRIPKQ